MKQTLQKAGSMVASAAYLSNRTACTFPDEDVGVTELQKDPEQRPENIF